MVCKLWGNPHAGTACASSLPLSPAVPCARLASGAGPAAAKDGTTLHFRTLLRAEPGYDAFLAKLGTTEQVAHWRYLKSKLNLYIDHLMPADVREAVGMAITKELVARAFGVGVVLVTRADEYVEAFVLTGLYGQGETREDPRVVQMYHEPTQRYTYSA